jgi:hypothetical protein
MSLRLARCVLGVLCLANSLVASDIAGIWAGQQPGRNGQTDDVAFRFKLDGQVLTGRIFGDEFDLPIAEAVLSGDHVRFTVTTTNYFSGTKTQFVYSGVVKGGELELVRERIQTAEEKGANRPIVKQTLKLKRLN